MRLWVRLPVIVRAVLSGFTVALIGTGAWAALSLANQKFLPVVPWAIVPTAIYLRLGWRWLRGEGAPSSTSVARRESLRANPVSPDAWGLGIFAGLLGWAALMPFSAVLARLVHSPAEAQPITLPHNMPFITAFLLLVTASIVAGVVEEAAFRGYMQGPIERRHGVVVALLLNGALFGAAHFTHHPAAVLPMLPFYMAVTAIYGGLAWATNSIVPGIIMHAAGDVFSLSRLWATGTPDWQWVSTPPGLVWETGPDASFWLSLAATLLFGAAAVWANVALARLVREERGVSARAAAGMRSAPS